MSVVNKVHAEQQEPNLFTVSSKDASVVKKKNNLPWNIKNLSWPIWYLDMWPNTFKPSAYL